MHENEPRKWWQFLCEAARGERFDAEEAGIELIESGAAGSQLLDGGRLLAFFSGTAEEAQRAAERFRSRGWAVCVEELPDENWMTRCSELWQPVRIGALTILPLYTAEPAQPQPSPLTVRLIPGMGFGTGHHASTRLALELLQDARFASPAPRRCLDVGTGSGILALACAALYSAEVDAIDNDPYALDNARENLCLNPAGARLVRLRLATVADCKSDYDVVLANLYSQLLLQMERDFYDRLEAHGALIMSGIDDGAVEALRAAYADRWRVRATAARDGWASMRLVKKW